MESLSICASLGAARPDDICGRKAGSPLQTCSADRVGLAQSLLSQATDMPGAGAPGWPP